MPGFVLHSLLAARTLDAWGDSGDAPFDTGDPAHRNAFCNGAMGPDVGYFPGGDRLLSDLPHYVHTGRLARELVGQARSSLEVAFAWGWVTHILGDVIIHPLINQAAGEQRWGDRGRPLSYADDPVMHVQFEVGADAICGLERWRAEPARLRPVFDETSVDYLRRCFAATYGHKAAGAAVLLASHRACARYCGFIWNLAAVVNCRLRGRVVPANRWSFYLLMYLPVKWGTSIAARNKPQYGATHAFVPPDWMAAEIETVVAEFPARFMALARGGLDSLPDYNLDLGIVDSDPPGYRLTLDTLDRLDKLEVRSRNPG